MEKKGAHKTWTDTQNQGGSDGKTPIREGLFSEGVSGDLMGARCNDCKHILPPLTDTCYYCYGTDLKNVKLSRRGKLYSYTKIYQPHKHFEVPYYVGYIDLPEGIRSFSPLKWKQGKPFCVGMPMKLSVEKLWGAKDSEVVGPKFEPK